MIKYNFDSIILNGGQILFWSIFFVLIILAIVMFTGNGFNGKTFSASIMIFYSTSKPLDLLLSKEIIASEIVRVLIGSIGLILAVPLVTVISIFLIKEKR